MMGRGGVSEQGWRKGPWTPEEDKLLAEYVSSHGEGRWSSVARCSGLNRSGKSCRLRWVNYLRPGLKRGHLTPQEEGIIIELHALWGNKWSTIARYLPGRTDNEIKNYWRTHFKKKGNPASDKQEKRKFHGQRNQQPENEIPEANASVSPHSDLTGDPKMMSAPQADQQETLSTYQNIENHCFPATYHEVSPWSDTIPLDGLWGWLWNLDDQKGRGGQSQASECGKMALQNQANVYNGGHIFQKDVDAWDYYQTGV